MEYLNDITKVKQLRTEYVQVWLFQDAHCWEKKKSYKFYIIVISICFSYITINVFLEGDRAGSWRKLKLTIHILDETGQEMEERFESPAVWEGPRTMFSVGPDHTPLNVILRDNHSKISAMGPELLATALRAITVSGPSVYHLVFTTTPYSPFLTVTYWRVFLHMEVEDSQ